MEQTRVFEAAETFARVEGILPAPESSHAICAAIDEAMKCRETGEEKTIVFGLTGTGYFDLVAYQKYHDNQMDDYVPTDEELALFPCPPAEESQIPGVIDFFSGFSFRKALFDSQVFIKNYILFLKIYLDR